VVVTLESRATRGAAVLVALARNPPEAIERARDRVSQKRERHHAEAPVYEVDSDWEQRFHEIIGARWPCQERGRFDALWREVVASLVAQDLRVGRGAFGGWDDADPALARATWCLALHLKPKVTVETGVARGLTTRFLLEAIERNGSGSLFSIDLPPLIRRDLAAETGAAVPATLRRRWTCIAGSSHRRLPALLDGLEHVDLFLHDSSHTTRNVLFELDLVWKAMVDGGVSLVDDVDHNRGFGLFTNGRRNLWSEVGRSDDGQGLIGLIVKSPKSPRSPEL
jgi:methyltransferase family protein